MFDIWRNPELPNLNPQNSRITSPATHRYNCIAWAANCTTQRWWPFGGKEFWPPGAPRKETLAAFQAAFRTLGYEECQDGYLEDNYEKIALFAQMNDVGDLVPTHAARQLPNGRWTSKLGDYQDIEHINVGDVDCPEYGTAVQFMRRSIS